MSYSSCSKEPGISGAGKEENHFADYQHDDIKQVE